MANLYWGWTVAELLDELKLAQRELATGQTPSSLAFGGGSASGQVQETIRQRIVDIWTALNALDATTYPLSTMRRDTITKIVFQ